MSGLTINTENSENNKIDEYMQYSVETGYTILKSGGYYITLETQVYPDQYFATTYLYFVVNGAILGNSNAMDAKNWSNHFNSFTFYLEQ